jgi:hypothetical protein
MRNIHVKGNIIYTPPIVGPYTKGFIAPQTFLMQDLLGEDYVVEDHGNEATNANVNKQKSWANSINLEDLL